MQKEVSLPQYESILLLDVFYHCFQIEVRSVAIQSVSMLISKHQDEIRNMSCEKQSELLENFRNAFLGLSTDPIPDVRREL